MVLECVCGQIYFKGRNKTPQHNSYKVHQAGTDCRPARERERAWMYDGVYANLLVNPPNK